MNYGENVNWDSSTETNLIALNNLAPRSIKGLCFSIITRHNKPSAWVAETHAYVNTNKYNYLLVVDWKQ